MAAVGVVRRMFWGLRTFGCLHGCQHRCFLHKLGGSRRVNNLLKLPTEAFAHLEIFRSRDSDAARCVHDEGARLHLQTRERVSAKEYMSLFGVAAGLGKGLGSHGSWEYHSQVSEFVGRQEEHLERHCFAKEK